MRDFVRYLILIMAGFAGAFGLQLCRSHEMEEPRRMVVADTVRVIDTVMQRMPEAAGRSASGSVTCRLAVVNPEEGSGGKPRSCAGGIAEGCDSMELRCDSAVVEIPLESRHYADSSYEAWVSGYRPRLDSIRVYRRMETVTVREYKPPDRWHLGISAGYGYTPSGFRPYIGIGISYSIISW